MTRLTRAQVREVDRRAIEEYGIPGIVLMENAARNAADVAMDMLDGVPTPHVAIACGGGNNGGDGFGIARHLHLRGVKVLLIDAFDDEPLGDAAINLDITRLMKLPRVSQHDAQDALRGVHLLIDALFGTGLKRAVSGDHAQLVHAMNNSGKPILAIDLPSGLNCDTGEPTGPAVIRARKTVTFVAQKAGFANPAAKAFTGEVLVADVGAPGEIVQAVLRESTGQALE